MSKCKYCKPLYKICSGKISHGENLSSKEDTVSVCVWTDGILNIETCVDDVYNQLDINFCPMCGNKLK